MVGMKTGADYARTYRDKQRAKLERLARLEAALREIAEGSGLGPEGREHEMAVNIARSALADSPSGFNEDR